jgi:aminoglycoside phosphotransferase
MASIPVQGLLEAGSRLPALSARVAELEKAGGAARIETPEAPDPAFGLASSPREDHALQELETLSGSDDAYQLARQRAEPWISVAGIVCDREGLPVGGSLQRIESGSRPAIGVPPGHLIKFYGPWDWGDILYDQEVLALQRLDRDASLPVSRLVATGRLSQNWRYAVISWLEGARLKDIDERLWTEDAADLMAWLGRFVRSLHALPLEPGEQADGLAQHREVMAYRHREAARRAGERNLLPTRLLEQIDAWMPPLEELLETSAGTVVVHADLTPSNVIGDIEASSFRPTRIIDFNQCVVGHAAYELGPVWWTIAEGDPERTRTFLSEAHLPGMTQAPHPRRTLAWAILNPAWRPQPFAWLDSVATLEGLAERAFGEREA